VLRVVVAATSVLALTGCGGQPAARSSYALMQMNLCLSGKAGCYDPAAVGEAIADVRDARPDAITVNEACRGDVATIARRTGYHLRFSRVLYDGRRLRCVHPRGRGLFGDAVLTRAPNEGAQSADFEAQAGPERRRWLCVDSDVDVCTAHLNTRLPAERAGNDAQCKELAPLLADRAAVFGGDVNRRDSCAPGGFWTRTDGSARQAAGLQHVYGREGAATAEVIPFRHSDHDVLVVRVTPRPAG
jgi:endonuclease/exonuclease/phosphatase family metal-dependent hydrolase